MELKEGTSIADGKYLIEAPLGKGSQGEVWKARQIGAGGFSKDVVIKVIQSSIRSDPKARQMFLTEAQLAARLQHPNIVELYDIGLDRDMDFIVMEHVKGRDLGKVLDDHIAAYKKPLPWFIVAKMMIGVCKGLHYAHTKKDVNGQPLSMIHRDMKPENLLLSVDGFVKIIDFGMAKASVNEHKTQTGVIKGTPSYMSPEQITARPTDARSDLFALGIILYELCSGRRPFLGEMLPTLIYSILEHEPTELRKDFPEIPRRMEDAIMRLLEKEPKDRFSDASILQRELEQIVREEAAYLEHDALTRFCEREVKPRLKALPASKPKEREKEKELEPPPPPPPPPPRPISASGPIVSPVPTPVLSEFQESTVANLGSTKKPVSEELAFSGSSSPFAQDAPPSFSAKDSAEAALAALLDAQGSSKDQTPTPLSVRSSSERETEVSPLVNSRILAPQAFHSGDELFAFEQTSAAPLSALTGSHPPPPSGLPSPASLLSKGARPPTEVPPSVEPSRLEARLPTGVSSPPLGNRSSSEPLRSPFGEAKPRPNESLKPSAPIGFQPSIGESLTVDLSKEIEDSLPFESTSVGPKPTLSSPYRSPAPPSHPDDGDETLLPGEKQGLAFESTSVGPTPKAPKEDKLDALRTPKQPTTGDDFLPFESTSIAPIPVPPPPPLPSAPFDRPDETIKGLSPDVARAIAALPGFPASGEKKAHVIPASQVSPYDATVAQLDTLPPADYGALFEESAPTVGSYKLDLAQSQSHSVAAERTDPHEIVGIVDMDLAAELQVFEEEDPLQKTFALQPGSPLPPPPVEDEDFDLRPDPPSFLPPRPGSSKPSAVGGSSDVSGSTSPMAPSAAPRLTPRPMPAPPTPPVAMVTPPSAKRTAPPPSSRPLSSASLAPLSPSTASTLPLASEQRPLPQSISLPQPSTARLVPVARPPQRPPAPHAHTIKNQSFEALDLAPPKKGLSPVIWIAIGFGLAITVVLVLWFFVLPKSS